MSRMSELSTDYPLHVHELAEAEANVGRLKAALEPFAAMAKHFKRDDARKGLAFTTPNLSPSDFIAAADAIAGVPSPIAWKPLLEEIVTEFGGAIEQYRKLGPHWTQKDGNETFDVGVILDREPLIERARALLAKAERS
jgi:hypothetical protein